MENRGKTFNDLKIGDNIWFAETIIIKGIITNVENTQESIHLEIVWDDNLRSYYYISKNFFERSHYGYLHLSLKSAKVFFRHCICYNNDKLRRK